MQNKMHKQAALAAMVAMALGNGPAWAGEDELREEIRLLAQKLEALQKQMAEVKAAPAAAPSAAADPSAPGAFKVSLFGTVDAAYGRQSNIAPAGAAASGSTSKFFNGGWAPSNFGVAGSVGLGEDLSGIFRLDTEFLSATGANLVSFSGQVAPSAYNGSNGTPVLFNRAAFGGLSSSKYGTLTLGRQQTVAVDAVVKVEPSGFVDFFMSSAYGAYNLGNAIYGQALVNTAAGKYSAGVSGNLDSRDNAMIKYTSPTFFGLKVIGGYSPGAVAGDDSAGTKAALGASWDYGPFSVGGSYSEWHPVDVVSSAEKKYRLSNFGIGYKLGALGLRAALGHTVLPAVTLKDASNANVAYSGATAEVYGIGATYAVTPKVNVVASYYSKKYDIATGNQPKVDTIGLAANYEFFKNAKLYALYDNARSRGDNAANQTLGGHKSANALALGFSYGFNADFSR